MTDDANQDKKGAEPQNNQDEQPKERVVPLEALEAERRKRQELEQQVALTQQQMEELAAKIADPHPQDDYEDEEIKQLKEYTQKSIKEGIKTVLERQFMQQHPELFEVNPTTGKTHLEEKLAPILAKKPWLTNVIASAENRYAMAKEIIDDYSPKESVAVDNKDKIEENQNLPKHPTNAKSSNLSSLGNIKNMSRAEFSRWRAQMLRRGRPNIV